MNEIIYLEDGIVFYGGELVFNTSITGYQEILDPSYTGQFHSEGALGLKNSEYLFEEFIKLAEEYKNQHLGEVRACL